MMRRISKDRQLRCVGHHKKADFEGLREVDRLLGEEPATFLSLELIAACIAPALTEKRWRSSSAIQTIGSPNRTVIVDDKQAGRRPAD